MALAATTAQPFMDAFTIKQNSFAQNEIAITATDTAGIINEGINGTYQFSINGFDTDLKFDHGVGMYHHKFDHSGFIYLKLNDVSGGCSSLYYVYVTDSRLFPFRINPMLLLIIPLVLILMGYMFRRFITIAAVLLLVFFYFNHHSGLAFTTYFASITDGLKHTFTHGFNK